MHPRVPPSSGEPQFDQRVVVKMEHQHLYHHTSVTVPPPQPSYNYGESVNRPSAFRRCQQWTPEYAQWVQRSSRQMDERAYREMWHRQRNLWYQQQQIRPPPPEYGLRFDPQTGGYVRMASHPPVLQPKPSQLHRSSTPARIPPPPPLQHVVQRRQETVINSFSQQVSQALCDVIYRTYFRV